MQTSLSESGEWQVDVADSPSEGVEWAIQHQPDAVVYDLSTVGMNFYAFLKRLQAEAATQDIPVILIGAEANLLTIELFVRYQVAGVIGYPVDPTQLPQQIASLLNWDEF